ncbi:hypothetical protein [Mycolicibacterium sp.]|uniref:hypothetical protein n=1 Tax=Mycolicibacterium sp. TaxID=2320850 RepID=UPI0037CC9E30
MTTSLKVVDRYDEPPLIDGSLPADELFISALLHSVAPTVVQIAALVDAQRDLDGPALRSFRAVVDIAQRGIAPAPELVADELRRAGSLDRRTACWLSNAASARVGCETARHYAAVVVATSVRRQIRNVGSDLAVLAATASEVELEVTIEHFAAMISDTFNRLAVLRGGHDGRSE